MIHSELAKELVSAGYTDDYLLSSLIHACGEQFGQLAREDWGPEDGGVHWSAFKNDVRDVIGKGSTPEIAVAPLYLLLNK